MTLPTMSAQPNAASQALWCLTANNYTFAEEVLSSVSVHSAVESADRCFESHDFERQVSHNIQN